MNSSHTYPSTTLLPMNQLNFYKRLLTRCGLVYSPVQCLFILGMGGFWFWLLTPRVLTLGDGFGLVFTTAATVGYGDIIPSTHASRAFGVARF
jgi:voltage-gated potassium channel